MLFAAPTVMPWRPPSIRPLPLLLITSPLFVCPSTPSLLLPVLVTALIVPSLITLPFTPGRTPSASQASINPVGKLCSVLLPVVIAFQSIACEPPAEAFSEMHCQSYRKRYCYSVCSSG